MLLQTTIKPRRDGTVTVEGAKKKFIFQADANGDLVCEVDDEALVVALLKGEQFMPVNEEDFGIAIELTQKGAEEDDDDLPVGDGDGPDDEDDDPVDPNALPLEGVGAGETLPVEDPAPAPAAPKTVSRRRQS